MKYDLVIRGGTLYDGSGTPGETVDIAVVGEHIVEVGRVVGDADRVVNADGAIVTPGFVDIHTHYDAQCLWSTHMTPSSWHGVTTLLMGNCGVGFAPAKSLDRETLIELMEGVEDIPGNVLREGFKWEWTSFPEYLDTVDKHPRDMDICAQIPHAPMRIYAMGARALTGEAATDEDVRTMGQLASEALGAGALGFSTSRSPNHKSSRGMLTPSFNATHDELLGIASAIRSVESGTIQFVSDFANLDSDMDLIRKMAHASNRPVSVVVTQRSSRPDEYKEVLNHISLANKAGLRITAQVATRPVGMHLGLRCSLHPFTTNRVFREIASKPVETQVQILQTAEFRARLLKAATEEQLRHASKDRLIDRFGSMFEIGDNPDYDPKPSLSLAARSAGLGVTPHELALEILCSGLGKGLLYVPLLNYTDTTDAVGDMLQHEYSIPGLSDAGAHLGSVCDASFPTTLLSLWARDRPKGRIDLSLALKRHCFDAAKSIGLFDRGLLQPGYRADVNVIDFSALRLTKPEIVYDLPAGGRRLVQRAEGYLHTFCAGIETWRGGVPTGNTPGRLVRGAREKSLSV